MVYNPLDETVKRTLPVPLYYTGLTDAARVRNEKGPEESFALDREYEIALPVEVGARSHTWFTIR